MNDPNAEYVRRVREVNDVFEDRERARDLATALIHDHPDRPEPHYLRGAALAFLREFDDALDDLDEALRLGFADPSIYVYRLNCHFGRGYDEDRLFDAERLLELSPGDEFGHYMRGTALDSLGDYEAAIEEFDRVVELNPDRWDVWYHRGLAWANLGDEERARTDYAKSMERPLTEQWIYHRRAHYWERREEYDRALADFASAIEAEPDATRHYNCRASLLMSLGEEERAEADYIAIERLNGEDDAVNENRYLIHDLAQEHFDRRPLETIDVVERTFPFRAAPDLQVALDRLGTAGFDIVHQFATDHGRQPVQQFEAVYVKDRRNPVKPTTPKYEEFDIGEEEPMRCLKDGLWLLSRDGRPAVVLLDTSNYSGIRLLVATGNEDEAQQVSRALFAHVEATIRESRCYRGKVLSLESKEMYSGHAHGIVVHRLKHVERENVILPRATLDLLDRNVIDFVGHRDRLAELGIATKKGLLFYGPPGTGKTHTIHYLAEALAGHTTFLISAEQVGELSEYMTLARFLEPSLVVIEDVDLIARDRADMRSAGEEVLLNKLLNEMDGLKPDTRTLFALTTNRPESLEEALASRPGRVDQAIEFPLPDEEGRAKLVRLYAHGVPVDEAVVSHAVEGTAGVSASFVKELMRRAIQFALQERDSVDAVRTEDVDAALGELLEDGGSLNRKLLGAGAHGRVGFDLR